MWKMEGVSDQGIADNLNNAGILSPLEYRLEAGQHFTENFKRNGTAVWNSKSRTASSSSKIATNHENGVIADALNIDNTTETANKVQAVGNPAFIGNTMPVNNTGNPVNVNLEAGSVNVSDAHASDRGLYE